MKDTGNSDAQKLKDVEFYSASVTAWYNSAFEHDKSILTLSSGGIALLVTLLTTIGARSPESMVLYALAVIFFSYFTMLNSCCFQ